MVSQRKVKGFKPIKSLRKPATTLSQAYVQHRLRDYAHTVNQSSRIIEYTENQPEVEAPDPLNHEPYEPDLNEHYMPGYRDDEIGWEDEEGEELIADTDENTKDTMIALVNSAQYQARRLKVQEQWRALYKQMLDIFIVLRARTNEWASAEMWNHDFKPPCACRPRERDIDMVDYSFRKKVKIKFCDCKPDQITLLYLGFIGSSPRFPRTAFSIRLLRLHHLLWKHACIRMQPFSKAIDEFLDANQPLILTKETKKPREWRKPLTAACEVYRQLLTLIREKEFNALQLDEKGQLAANCPRCFAPPLRPNLTSAPDMILCLDGNFQHRRHKAASVPITGLQTKSPELFLEPEVVNAMAEKSRMVTANHQATHDEDVHPCTEQHTAADDARGKGAWPGCDETGLFGMVCRHDHSIKFVNIVQSGEKIHFAFALIAWILCLTADRAFGGNRVGILYDIGCNAEKSVKKRRLFEEERQADRLKFGTSVFHSYVHEWNCQLDYNPRLNEGWGLTDGEGNERVWAFMDPLIPPCRYSTKENRLVSINLRALHHNEVLLIGAIKSMEKWKRTVESRLSESTHKLNQLCGIANKYTVEYFGAQWKRQKTLQSNVISATAKSLRNRMSVLMDLEEELVVARETLGALEAKNARTRTQEDRNNMLSLPHTLVLLEIKMDEVAKELGSEEFRRLTGTSDHRAKALLAIQIAKAKLYESKVDDIEMRKRADRTRGARNQARMARLKRDKATMVSRKHQTYIRHAAKYNRHHRPTHPIPEPTLDEIRSLDLSDPFWDGGGLSHPDEDWAVDPVTIEGIQAFLKQRGCKEELVRIAVEVRQILQWAISHQTDIDLLYTLDAEGYEGEELTSKQALRAGISKRACHKWMAWNSSILFVLKETSKYLTDVEVLDRQLEEGWVHIMSTCSARWEELIGEVNLVAEVEIAEGVVDDHDLEGDWLDQQVY